MTPLGYNKTIMEEFGEIARLADCPVMCPAVEAYDQENTDETADELEKRFNQSVEDKRR
jgi:hypothetical protein